MKVSVPPLDRREILCSVMTERKYSSGIPGMKSHFTCARIKYMRRDVATAEID